MVANSKDLMTDNGNPRHIAIIMDGNGRWAVKKMGADPKKKSTC